MNFISKDHLIQTAQRKIVVITPRAGINYFQYIFEQVQSHFTFWDVF